MTVVAILSASLTKVLLKSCFSMFRMQLIDGAED